MESFRKEFPNNVEPLRTAVAGRELHEGDLTLRGDGATHDAQIKIDANIRPVPSARSNALWEV